MEPMPDMQPEVVNGMAESAPQAAEEIPVVRLLRRELEEAREDAARIRRAALEALYAKEDSNLLAHAQSELERAGLLAETSDYGGMLGRAVLDLIRVFAGEGHSGSSAHITIDIFKRLASFDILTPLTDHPSEWMEVGTGMWQSTRKPSVFWRTGEATWYDLDAIVSPPDPNSGTPDPEPVR